MCKKRIDNCCTCLHVSSWCIAVISLSFQTGWIDVTWDHGASNSYRMGAEGKYDLKLAPGYDPESPQVSHVTGTVSCTSSNTATSVTPSTSVATITTAVRSTKVR